MPEWTTDMETNIFCHLQTLPYPIHLRLMRLDNLTVTVIIINQTRNEQAYTCLVQAQSNGRLGCGCTSGFRQKIWIGLFLSFSPFISIFFSLFLYFLPISFVLKPRQKNVSLVDADKCFYSATSSPF
jgi:hypothetical protein